MALDAADLYLPAAHGKHILAASRKYPGAHCHMQRVSESLQALSTERFCVHDVQGLMVWG